MGTHNPINHVKYAAHFHMCIHLLSTFQDGNPLLKQLLSPFNKCAVNLQTEFVFVLLSLVSYHCIYIYHVSVHSEKRWLPATFLKPHNPSPQQGHAASFFLFNLPFSHSIPLPLSRFVPYVNPNLDFQILKGRRLCRVLEKRETGEMGLPACLCGDENTRG